MNIKNVCKLSLALLAFIALFGCGEADEAKELGFSSVVEMRSIQAKGWHTKNQYAADMAAIALGYKSSDDMESEKRKLATEEQDRKRKEEEERARILTAWKNKTNWNFLIGMCVFGDQELQDCSIQAAKNMDEFFTGFRIFTDHSFIGHLIYGKKYYSSMPEKLQKERDSVTEVNISYLKQDEPNQIIVVRKIENDCPLKELFTLKEDGLYQRWLELNDSKCTDEQIKINNYSVKGGEKKSSYIIIK